MGGAIRHCTVTLYVGEGSRGNSAACSVLSGFQSLLPLTKSKLGPSGADFLGEWFCVHSRNLWVSPRSSPVGLGVSPAAASTPTGVFSQRFEALFPGAGALGCAVCGWVCQPPPRRVSSLPQLPISTPPTGLGECFFFISLVVRLPCCSIFCQFWLFFVFKLLLSFFWLCEEAQCVYLHLHFGQKS